MADKRLVFEILARDSASKALADVGTAAEKTGKQVGKVGEETEKGADRGRKALGLLSSTFVSSSAGALGPLQEIAEKFSVIGEASETASSKSAKRLIGIGAAATGAGAFLSSLASRDEEAQNRLKAAIEASGHSFANYKEKLEKAIKAGEHFGNQASTTSDALNRLTITTHSPEEAFKALSTAQDVAAAKGISLSKAAEVVGLTFNGSTRAGKQFGLKLEDIKKVSNELAAAQKGLTGANDKVAASQLAYTQKLAVYQQTAKPTLATQQSLFNSHNALIKAQEADKAAKERLTEAQKKANEATHAGEDNVAKLAAVVKGQGEASADSFSGHLRALGARIENTGASLGKDLGGALTAIGPVLLGVGVIIETGMIQKLGGLILAAGKSGLSLIGFGTVATEQSGIVALALNAEATAADESAARMILAFEAESGAAATSAAGIAASAAIASTALEGEAAVAVTSAARITGALAGIGAGIAGALGSLAMLPGAFPDLKMTGAPGGPGSAQEKFYRSFQNGNRAPDTSKLTQADADALRKLLGNTAPANLRNLTFPGLPSTFGVNPARQRALQDQQAAQRNRDLNSDNPLVAARAQKALAAANAAVSKTPATVPEAPQSFADFLAGIGNGAGGGGGGRKGGSGAAKRAQSGAQAAARAAIKAYQEDLRAKIAVDKAKIASEQRVIDSTNKTISKLKDQQKVYADYAKSIADGVKSFDSLGNLGSQVKGQNAGGIAQLLGGRFQQNKFFGDTLARLGKQGLNKNLLNQVAQGGPDQNALLFALQDATPDQIKALNTQQDALDKQTGGIGQSALFNQFGTEPQKTNAALAVANRTQAAQLAEQKKTNVLLVSVQKALAAVGTNAQATARASAGHGGRA
jgi:hypothetical protein